VISVIKIFIYSMIVSAVVIAYILSADYLYAHELIVLDSFIYQVDMLLLYPSYFIMAVFSGWNRAQLEDVPYYVFKVLSFLIYFVGFYLVQVMVGKIKAKSSLNLVQNLRRLTCVKETVPRTEKVHR